MFGIDDMIGAGIGAAGGLIGGILQSGAIKQAAQTEAAAANHAADLAAQGETNALNFTKDVYGNTQNAEQPYTTAGKTALGYLSEGTAPGGVFNSTPTAQQVMAEDPGYQFNLQQGQQALERAEAAGGNVGSGGALKAASQYATNYATNAFGDAYNRFLGTRQSNYNNLANLANLGEEANRTVAGAGQNAAGLTTNASLQGANMQGNDLTGAASAQAAGTVGSTNALANAFTTGGNIAMQYPILAQLANQNNQSSYDVGTNPADMYGPAPLLQGGTGSQAWLYGGQPPSYDYTSLAALGS